jgi:hypothetical protein
VARAQTDKAQAQHLLALARRGGTEMSLMLAALRDAGVPGSAPAPAPAPAAGNGKQETGNVEPAGH